jgi:hypothetical protein
LEKIKAGYYSQLNVNQRASPIGPNLDHLELPHDRSRLPASV